ncbi:MAG: HAMP domain-containing protein [Rhodospirillales bacterium]|nr:HAMP domain-containing protein [Rhodospirillales bacterium]
MRRINLRLPRSLRTASFRLATLYAGLFTASVLILGAVSLWTIGGALDRQMSDRIGAEIATLQATYHSGGLAALVAAVRARERGLLALDFAVEQPSGTRLAGVLPRLPTGTGWMRVEAGPRSSDSMVEPPEHLRVLVTGLAGGGRLAVGDDLARIDDVQATVLTAFGWVAVLVAALGIGGGFLMSMGFLRRLDAITRTAEAIIAGELSQRIPLRGSGDDLDRLAATLNRMLDRIAALMESLRQISNDIAHDLRTPLSRLCQGLSAARGKAGTTAEYERAIDHAIAEAEGILQTFGALLRIAQIEAGSRRAGFRDVDLAEIVATVADVFEPVAEDQHHHLRVMIAPAARDHGATIHGDRELLVQALVNLIENALRHTPDGSTVTVFVAMEEGAPALSVADDGPGVPESERTRILDRFYRREASRTTSGSGLGLSLVAAVAELHQAELRVDDAAPGLRVRLRFSGL